MTEAKDENVKVKNKSPGDMGYVFYSKRKNLVDGVDDNSQLPLSNIKTSLSQHNKCLKHAMRCIKEDPFAKLLIKALQSKGW